MADEMNFDGLDSTTTGTTATDYQENPIAQMDNTNDLQDPNADLKNIQGLTQKEIEDYTEISVTIQDPDIPIVILFGPAACGKSMTLVRLARYLRSKGYTVEPERSFRPAEDYYFKRVCDNFDQYINSDRAKKGTDKFAFMLAKVEKEGRTLCQILEAPGELYFSPTNPQRQLPHYVDSIRSSNNRTVWCFMVEPDWMNPQDRRNYVSRIHSLFNRTVRDKVIFILNKIDKHSTKKFIIDEGKVDAKGAMHYVNTHYPAIFTKFMRPGFFGKKRCFEFVPFQTGTYHQIGTSDEYRYEQGSDAYPAVLWKTIQKVLNGR